MAQRKRRLLRTNGLCEMCLPRPVIATVVDHIVPLALGGSDEDSNTRNLCDEHHRQVTAEQFGQRQRPTIGLDGWPVTEGGGEKSGAREAGHRRPPFLLTSAIQLGVETDGATEASGREG
ncbi:MAG TPA: HNH endonuclease signature motif containing protein [Sphingomicrobium sp.]|nr:HNH endonuclease signature motif containing protein [Sphingomicrobium sp.]